MVIDTKVEASTLRKTKTFVLIVYVVLVVVIATFIRIDTIDKAKDTAYKFMICGSLSVFFLLFYWFQYNMKYTYLYFSNNSKNFVIKFYSMQLFWGKPRTIEIPKTSFVKYDIVMGFLGKRDSLVLYQKTPKGIAKYPPISLTLLSKKQKIELERALIS